MKPPDPHTVDGDKDGGGCEAQGRAGARGCAAREQGEMAHEQDREVTTPCPRCGQLFVLEVGRHDGGHAVDVVGWACACDLTEDEYEDLCDAAVAAYAATPAPPPPPVSRAREAPPAASRPWWRRLFGGE